MNTKALTDALRQLQIDIADRDPMNAFFALAAMSNAVAVSTKETAEGKPDSTAIGKAMDALAVLRNESPIHLWMVLSSILIVELEEDASQQAKTKGDPRAN